MHHVWYILFSNIKSMNNYYFKELRFGKMSEMNSLRIFLARKYFKIKCWKNYILPIDENSVSKWEMIYFIVTYVRVKFNKLQTETSSYNRDSLEDFIILKHRLHISAWLSNFRLPVEKALYNYLIWVSFVLVRNRLWKSILVLRSKIFRTFWFSHHASGTVFHTTVYYRIFLTVLLDADRMICMLPMKLLGYLPKVNILINHIVCYCLVSRWNDKLFTNINV